MIGRYVVSKDKRSNLWYAHNEKTPNIPVSGSFSEKKSEAQEYAKMYNCLPNKVQEIEDKRETKCMEEIEND